MSKKGNPASLQQNCKEHKPGPKKCFIDSNLEGMRQVATFLEFSLFNTLTEDHWLKGTSAAMARNCTIGCE